MKFCKFCGTELEDNATFCSKCGKQVEGEVVVNSVGINQTNATCEKSSKSKIAAGLLQIFLGGLGIGRFYTGHIGIAVAQLVLSIFSCGAVGGIWGLIDGIVILTTKDFKDADGKIME